MIVGWTGLPGSSKTTRLARMAIELLYRNRAYYHKSIKLHKKNPSKYAHPILRPIVSNIHFSKSVIDEFGDRSILYWSDLEQLPPLRHCDVLIDEAMVYFDARSWEHLSLDVRRWLAQHRKHGVEIYFTSQEFMQVDIAFRRLVSHLFYLSKLVGSRDISATLPPPSFIWGIVRSISVDPINYDEQTKEFRREGFPSFSFITRADTEVFDTTQEIKASKWPPLRHIKRMCSDDNCSFIKIQHV